MDDIYTKKDIYDLVRDYYSKVDFDIPLIQRREIAFQNWGEAGIRDRHRYFQTNEDLKRYLSQVPKADVPLRRLLFRPTRKASLVKKDAKRV